MVFQIDEKRIDYELLSSTGPRVVLRLNSSVLLPTKHRYIFKDSLENYFFDIDICVELVDDKLVLTASGWIEAPGRGEELMSDLEISLQQLSNSNGLIVIYHGDPVFSVRSKALLQNLNYTYDPQTKTYNKYFHPESEF